MVRRPSPAKWRRTPPGDPPGAHSAGPRPTAPRPRCPPVSFGCGSAPTTARRPGHPTTSPTSSPAPARPPTSTDRTPPCGRPRRPRRPSTHSAARLRDEAAKSAALAEALDDRARQLTEADEVRAAWYAHTAETRAAAERAAAELATRQADRPAEPPPVTAKEWLAAHDAEARAEDPHRPITDDHDLTDTADQRARDQRDARADGTVAGVGRTASARHPRGGRRGGRRREACRPTTALQTPYAYPLPTRPPSPYAGRSARCTNSSSAKPPTPATPRTRPATRPHAGTLSS